MSIFATITVPLTPSDFLVEAPESASPEDLENLVNAALAKIAIEGAGPQGIPYVTAMTLAGGGDGHTFIVNITAFKGPIGQVENGVLSAMVARVTCYMAATSEELLKAEVVARRRLFAVLTGPNATFLDSQLAGASQGTHFMGMLVGSAG